VVDLVASRLGRATRAAITASTAPLPLARPGPLPDVDRVTPAVLADPVMLERVVTRAVREEMALTLADVVLRRTQLLHHGDPGTQALRRIAEIIGGHLEWSSDRLAAEIATATRYSQVFAT
jgi:glycerol-3-phosphate dehydrogenase